MFRVVALPSPTERQNRNSILGATSTQLPAAGEIVIFDRGWYNRSGVEQVMGFCAEEQVKFSQDLRRSSRNGRQSGIILLKYWMEVTADEHTRRLGRASTTAETLEAIADGLGVSPPLVRLLACTRCHVQGGIAVFAADRLDCEFAITVASEYGGAGLATLSMSQLIEEARRRGMREMKGSC